MSTSAWPSSVFFLFLEAAFELSSEGAMGEQPWAVRLVFFFFFFSFLFFRADFVQACFLVDSSSSDSESDGKRLSLLLFLENRVARQPLLRPLMGVLVRGVVVEDV